MKVYKDSTGAEWREQANGSYMNTELRRQEDKTYRHVQITLPLRYLQAEFGPLTEVTQ